MYNLNDYVLVEIYAEAYHSSAIFETSFLITKEFYNKHSEKINSFVFSVCDLDGKHSEVDADTTVIKNVNLNNLYILKLTFNNSVCALDTLLSELKDGSYAEIKELNLAIINEIQIDKTITLTFQNESKMIGVE